MLCGLSASGTAKGEPRQLSLNGLRPFPMAPGCERLVMTEITLRKGEPVERALRRLKKKLSREGTFEQIRRRRYFEKPSMKARRKLKAARFTAMLRERYADQ
jgi:small subunit ribosomal protein S21